MTRLLFVHGIAQEGKSSAKLKSEWLKSLNKGLKKTGRTPVTSAVMVPFYGDKLASWTKSTLEASMSADERNRGLHPDQITRSEPPLFSADPDFSKFAMEFAADAVTKAPGAAAQALATSLEARAAKASNGDFEQRGPQNWPPIVQAIRALERALPSLGSAFIESFLKTTHCYLTVNGAFNDVNKIITDELTSSDEPVVVVGHSLGSVVTYHVLHAKPQIEVPLYITVGSPLAIGAVKTRLKIQPKVPGGVLRWFNAFDEQDVVALNPLDESHFMPGDAIENYPSVKNSTNNHHGVIGYLDDEVVAKKISEQI